MDCFDLMDRACLIYNQGQATAGMSLHQLSAIAKESDLLINLSGHLKTEVVLGNVKRRLYLDQDPVCTQLWCAAYWVDLNFKRHDVFVTVGLNIGTSRTPIPDCGVTWHHTLPPPCARGLAMGIDASRKRFTTIASLRAFGELCYQGEWYGSKHEELERFAQLPRMVTQKFEIAAKYYRAEEPGLRRLADDGWLFSDSSQIADLSAYQRYIARSRAEIGIVTNAVVKARSGWFSDRWSHYLASGKPVLAQATGFEDHVPTGLGIVAFRSMDEAVAGVKTINADYVSHCRAARDFAEAYLDYRKVLPRILEACTGQ